MNIFINRNHSERFKKAFFSTFVIFSIVLSQVALPLNYAFAEDQDEQQCEAVNTYSDFVSDETTTVDGNPSVGLSFIHPEWTANISGAKWIWSTDPVQTVPETDVTKVFTKTVNITDTPTSASLQVAADNSYTLKVNGNSVAVAFDQNNFQIGTQDTYDILPLLVTGSNTLEFTVTNWGVGQSTNPAENPAGLLFKLSVINTNCSTPTTSTVTMCKADAQENMLSGWQLKLSGSSVGSVNVIPDGNDHVISNVPAGDYILNASGKYTYRPSEPDALYTDAAYSKRLAGDYVGYSGPFLPWMKVNDFAAPYQGWLGVMFNNLLTDWGSVFNPSHEYSLGTNLPSTANMSFKILDDNYTDNTGFITVDVQKGYTGVTGENGCVEFKNVPFGTYTVSEIMKDGWKNISGLGSVTVDGPTETFIVVNDTINDTGESTMVKVHIYKYLKNGETIAQIPNDSDAPAFPMNSLWNAENIGSASGAYFLGNYEGQGALKYAADTSNMSAPADYTTEEVTDGSLVVPTNSESCPAGKYRLLGYKSGTALNTAETATLYPTAPVFTDISVDQHVIVVNEKCPDVLGETASSNTTVVKGEDLAADFTAVIATPTKWFFWNDENNTINNTIGAFVSGPATAPQGSGSAQMSVVGTERRNIATYQFKDIKLSNIKTLSFSTYSQLLGDGALGLSERAPYLNFNVDFDNSDTWQRRLVFVPAQNGVVTADTWQTWDAINSGNALWVYSGATWPTTSEAEVGVPGTTMKTWNEILVDYPNAETRSTDSWFGFRVGEPYNNGFTGNVDKFVIGIKTGLNTHTETYDFEPTVSEPAPMCSDESDNDEDGLVDANDPGCMSGEGGSYNPLDNDESNTTQTFSGGGGGSGGGGIIPPSNTPAPTGSVLGASTSCGIYLNDFLKMGQKNNSEQVKKLQTFLNDYLKLDPKLPVTGVFGFQTYKAVLKFQEQESDQVLKPWVGITLKNAKKGTGYVYKTTITHINNIMCPELNLPIPTLD